MTQPQPPEALTPGHFREGEEPVLTPKSEYASTEPKGPKSPTPRGGYIGRPEE